MSRVPKVGKLGFSLIEILLVVFIIGLFAGLLLPRYSTSREQTKVAVTKANLEMIRAAIALYKEEENATPWGDLSMLYDGNSPSHKRYISGIPKEAITNSNVVRNAPTQEGGWCYDQLNEKIVPDLAGVDTYGQPYSEY